MGKIRSLFRRRASSKASSPSAAAAEAAAASPTSPRSPTAGTAASPTSPRSPTAGTAAAAEEELERVFRKFDSNGDGRISRSELAAIFESLGHPATEEELDRMMSEADADGDGFISLAEFAELNASSAGDAAAVEEDLRHAFSVFDLDRNGSISADELARVLRGLGEAASVAQCRRMIDGVDRDGDGLVSFEEFKVMMANGSSSAAAIAGLAKIG